MNRIQKSGIGLGVIAALLLSFAAAASFSIKRTESLDRDAGVASSPAGDALKWAWNAFGGGSALSVASVVTFLLGLLKKKLPSTVVDSGPAGENIRMAIDVGEIGLYLYLVQHTTSAKEKAEVIVAARTAVDKLRDTKFPVQPVEVIPAPVVITQSKSLT